VQVVIQNIAFTPAKVTVRVGDIIEWINKDVVAHTATASHSEFRTIIQPGQTSRLTMKQAGTFSYFCEYHPNMKAGVVVAPRKKKTASLAGAPEWTSLFRSGVAH
jgi:plastocyanin